MEHRLDAAAVILRPLIGLIFGLASSSSPNLDKIFAGFRAPVEVIAVVLERQDQPFFGRQRRGDFAILHFMGRVVVANPLLRVFVQHHTNEMAVTRQDDAGLSVGDEAADRLRQAPDSAAGFTRSCGSWIISSRAPPSVIGAAGWLCA